MPYMFWLYRTIIRGLHVREEPSLRHFRKSSSKSSKQHSEVVNRKERWEIRKTNQHLCIFTLSGKQWTYRDIQLTSGSAFISRKVIGTGSTSSAASEPSSDLIFMA
jgi:hypothetical protein